MIRRILFQLRMWQLSILQGVLYIWEIPIDFLLVMLVYLQTKNTWIYDSCIFEFIAWITLKLLDFCDVILLRMKREIDDVKIRYLP